ncbi:MAG: hypothetical protein M3N47_06970 [Chloroflexota bacterium]|nr:hypothetical protein [Chloroflexota bacterium]
MSDTFDPEKYANKKAAYEAGKKEGYLSALDGETDDKATGGALTFADVRGMSQDEITARWDEVQEVLKKSGAA